MSLNIPITDRKRIVVIGGGFAGMAAIKILARHDFQIVLIDRNNYHKFQPLLYQVATAALNPSEIAFPFRKHYKRNENVLFRLMEVLEVDPVRQVVITGNGELQYDALIIACGSATNFFGMEDIRKDAMTMKELSDSLAIRNRVLLNIENSLTENDPDQKIALRNIVIVGGGASGIELAGAFAEMKKYILPKDYHEIDPDTINICLVEGAPKLIGTMSDRTSRETYRELSRMGVNIILDAPATGFRDNKLLLKDGRAIPTHNLVWTSGVKVDLPGGMEKATVSKAGRILTNENLRVEGYDHIYAVGDASWQQSEKYPNGYPQLAREAISQGKHAARNIVALYQDKEQSPYIHREYPVLATIGRNKAFFEYKKVFLKGFVAWFLWAGVHIISILGARNRLSILWGWFLNYITMDHPSRIIVKLQRIIDSRDKPRR